MGRGWEGVCKAALNQKICREEIGIILFDSSSFSSYLDVVKSKKIGEEEDERKERKESALEEFPVEV